MNSFKEFINKYSSSKTLRFELIPTAKTKEFIEERGILTEDEIKAEKYKKAKKIIDEYHKYFIDIALDGAVLSNVLSEFAKLYDEKNKDDKKKLEEAQKKLRAEVVANFKKEEVKDRFTNLFKKDLIKNAMEFVQTDSFKGDKEEALDVLKEFEKHTTYFTGFNQNRENIYTKDEKSTAIAYRLIHQNLPKFLDNIKIFEKLKENRVDYKSLEIYYGDVLNGLSIEDFFNPEAYSKVLTQKAISKYNKLLGGYFDAQGVKYHGINERINLFNQKNNLIGRRKIPKLNLLFKQILSDRESESFVIDEFKDDEELLNGINVTLNSEIFKFETEEDKELNVAEACMQIPQLMKDADLGKVYIKNENLSQISQKLYKDWSIIPNALKEFYLNDILKGKKKLTKQDGKNLDKWLKSDLSISVIEGAVAKYENDVFEIYPKEEHPVITYFEKLGKWNDDDTDLLSLIDSKFKQAEELLNTDYEGKLATDKESKRKIKELLDSLLDLLHYFKPLSVSDITLEKDLSFYGFYERIIGQLDKLIPLYNKVRNYVTQKPYSTEKFKLNFDNSTLLDGWDRNKERDNYGLLFKKDGLYYLGIMTRKDNKIFEKPEDLYSGGGSYEKIEYKLLPGPNKMLPKVFLSAKGIADYAPSEELLSKYKKGTHKKGADFVRKDCYDLIDFFKASINKHPDWKHFNFKFSDTSSYDDISDFYREVAEQGYKITFRKISVDKMDEMVNSGKLYLFQIYNKDFSEYSTGKPNLHTIYWKMLFDERNLKNVVYQLNGGAEVFYRKKSIPQTTVHKAGEKIERRTDGKVESVFSHDIVKNKRFTLDKFQFHVPITLNFKAKGTDNINRDMNKYLQNNPDVNIIGLDRGERHLIYLTLINQKGEILHQESLNKVLGVNYHDKLDKIEKERTEARKNWDDINNIKELKSGYLSQVVHKIVKMMVDYNAIVVMEDLNFGFKRGRIKVEKQVYQKFEKALIDKLNYLVFKDRDSEEPGGALKAYQLASKFVSFSKMGKQSGAIYYVTADYTSKIDPTTGFVNLLRTKYENIEKSKEFFSKFKSIKYNKEADLFEFDLDYKDFTARAAGNTRWTICSYGERIVYNRNKKETKAVNITEELKALFADADYLSGKDLKGYITGSESKQTYEKLYYLLGLILSMRQSDAQKDLDYILSPVRNAEGKFYDSRNADDKLPKNADANGAYNIALKGLMLLDKINEGDTDKNIKFAIANKEWFEYAQSVAIKKYK